MNPQTTILEDGTEVVLVHFLCDTKDGKRIACTPNLEVLHSSHLRHVPVLRSEEVRAVSCPVCKRSSEYRKAEVEFKRASR